MPLSCKDAQQKLSEIKETYVLLCASFDLIKQGNAHNKETQKEYTTLRTLRNTLKTLIAELKNELNPFPESLKLKEQYEDQVSLLKKLNILKTFKDGSQGIMGIDKKPYTIPSFEAVTQKMKEKKELFLMKIDQGFTKLILVPFGMKLDDLIEVYKKTLKKHAQQGNLYYPPLTPEEIPQQIPDNQLNKKEPLWIWDEYTHADEKGNLVYFPQSFSPNHQGSTKQQLLAKKGGWHILLMEDIANLPRNGDNVPDALKPKSKGKIRPRTPIDNLGTQIRHYMEQGKEVLNPHEYLKAMQHESQNQDSPYYGEQGITPEQYVLYALTHLEKTNQVIDDYQGNGRISLHIGAYFTNGNVPIAYWVRAYRQVYLNRHEPWSRYEDYGARFVVRV